jgi:HlyD family secretion protein
MSKSTSVKKPFKLTSLILPMLAVAGLIFALYSVLSRPTIAAKAPALSPPVTPQAQTISGIGVIEPKSEMINIGVELPGVVREVFVSVGQEVEKGTPLFALDGRANAAELGTLMASLKSSQINAETTKTALDIIQKVDDPRAVSKDEVNSRKYAYQFAQAKVEEIRAQINANQTQRARLTVNAPISGRILDIKIRPGEFAQAGALGTPLMRMGDVSRLYVRVEIDEENMSRLKESASAFGTSRGQATDKLSLSFVRFEPYVQPKQNLAVAGQRVDTRVMQVLYALPAGTDTGFVGQQLDVFIDAPLVTAKASEGAAK